VGLIESCTRYRRHGVVTVWIETTTALCVRRHVLQFCLHGILVGKHEWQLTDHNLRRYTLSRFPLTLTFPDRTHRVDANPWAAPCSIYSVQGNFRTNRGATKRIRSARITVGSQIPMAQVTLRDVAKASGVSTQTVSRVINQRPDVSEATRAHVWEMIRHLGYKPNTLARGLVSRRSHMLGIITLPLNDYFRTEILTGLERQARSMGYACQISYTNDDASDLRDVIDSIVARQVDGVVILTPRRFTDPELIVNVPIVTLAHKLENQHAINVDVDNVDGAYQAMRYLLSLGHRAIGQISGPMEWTPALDRIEGARRALAEYHLEQSSRYLVECREWSFQAGYDAAHQLLTSSPEITALFCHTDWMAAGAYRALRELQLRIPNDVSVVGYDDLPICQYLDPPLASVRQPGQGLGQLLAHLVITAIERTEPFQQEMLVPAELVVRDSVGVPNLDR
jgi:LacI family transcriptional regulator